MTEVERFLHELDLVAPNIRASHGNTVFTRDEIMRAFDRTLAKSAQPTEAMVSAAYDAGYNRAVEHANSRGWRSADKERDLAALHSIGEA